MQIKKKININYIIALLCMLGCMIGSICKGYFIRNLAQLGINVVMINGVQQLIAFALTTISLWIAGASWKSRYINLHLIRALLTVIAETAWNYGLTIEIIPLYLSSFIALVIPSVNMVISVVLLNEKQSNYTLAMGLCVILPIARYLLVGKYVISILLLVIACILYALLDCTGAFVTYNERYKASRLSKIFRIHGNEGLMTSNFYNALCSTVVQVFFSVIIALTNSGAQTSLVQILYNTENYWKYIALGVLSWSSIPLLFIAYRKATVSSIQPIKAFEPIIAGSIIDKHVPNGISVGVIGFFIVSLIMILRESSRL